MDSFNLQGLNIEFHNSPQLRGVGGGYPVARICMGRLSGILQ